MVSSAGKKCTMEEELSQLKKTLISLVVSSPTTMTVSCLMKDYRNMIGGPIPLAKYGYREFVPFLRERCTDIFIIEGPTWDPILTPKVTKNLAHIDQMVQKQKVQSTVKYKGKRRSVLQPTPPTSFRPITRTVPPIRHDPLIKNDPTNRHDPPIRHDPSIRHDPTIRHENPPVVKNNNIGTQIQVAKPITQDIKKENNMNGQKDKFIDGYNSTYKNNANNTSYINEKENISNSVKENSPSSNALNTFYKKRLPQYNSDMDFPSPDTEQNSKSSAESGRQSSASSNTKQTRLDELTAEIIALIKDSAEGVWCTDLIRLYKERYGRELKSNRYGHTSLISLIYSMEHYIAISRPIPDGDWLLRDPLSAQVSIPTRRTPRFVTPRANPTNDEDALPGIDFEPDVFPPDCLHYMDTIPSQPLSSLTSGSQLEVLIGEVYSPSHFWMIRVGPQYNLAMEQIMDEMNEYYLGEGASRVLARGAIREGQYCASLFANDWHRSLIVSIIDSETVKVRHVDYGTVDTVPCSALKPLLRPWSLLPAQGIRSRLAACRPAAAGWRWPRAACAAFLHSVQDKRLYANVLNVNQEEDIVETFLIDTTGAEDVCLTRELIRSGHADKTNSTAKSSDRYLYPRFAQLECGATPNYAEICRILADGIVLEYVDSYRKHVPGPWVPNHTPPPTPPLSPPPTPPLSRPPTPPLSPLPSPTPIAKLLEPFELMNRVPLQTIDKSIPPQSSTNHPTWCDLIPPPPQYQKWGETLPSSSQNQKRGEPLPPSQNQKWGDPLPPSQNQKWGNPLPPVRPLQPQPRYNPPMSNLQHIRPPPPPPPQWSLPQPPLPWNPPLPSTGDQELRLSESEWAVFSHLRSVDASAANWYLLSHAWRSVVQPPPPPPGLWPQTESVPPMNELKK